MANFSVNQVLQMYVASAYNATVDGTSSVGTIGAVSGASEDLVQGKQVMFKFKGADTVLRSDLIAVKNISYAKAIKAADMVTVMRKVEITLDSNVNSGAPVAGQDYVLGINFKNFFSSGDASQYYKDAAVHATSSMTASDFYKAMVDALNKAFAREDSATATSNPYLSFSWKPNATTATTADAIVIEEKPQEWALGIKKARRIMFDILFDTIYTGGEDVTWGVATDATPTKANAVVGTNAVGNGQQIADLEWFAAGERGDQYRNVGWPNVIPTTYLANAATQYDVLEIHYAFTDSGVNSYRTEKEICIAFPKATTYNSSAAINQFIDAFNTAAGSTIISTLS